MSDPTPSQASEATPAVPTPIDATPAPPDAGVAVVEPAAASAVEPAPVPEDPREGAAAPAEAAPVDAPAAAPPNREPPPTLAQTAARLAELFPALFGGPARPIKLRIQADIQARAPGVFGRRELSLFLHRHTTSTAYLKSMVGLRQRFDLDGAPAGEVAGEHLAAATVELERRWAIVLARRQEQGRGPRKGPPRDTAAIPAEAAAGSAAEARRPVSPTRPPRGPRPPDHGPPQGEHTAADTKDRSRRPGRPDARPEGSPGGRRPEGDASRADRPSQAQRARHERASPGGPRGDRSRPPARGAGPSPTVRSEQPTHPQARSAAPTATWSPEDQARRDRAQLLRAFESSPLSKANFCVLKRIGESELDAQLAQARAERAAWQREHPPQPRPAR